MAAFTKTRIVTNKVTNPTFASGDNWICVNGWSIGSGKASCDNTGFISSLMYQSGFSFVSGNKYKVRFRIIEDQTLSGILSVVFYQNDTVVNSFSVTNTEGVKEDTYQLTGQANRIGFFLADANAYTCIDNVAVVNEDQYATIGTALSALGDNGGTVVVEQGVYPIDGVFEETISIKSNCSIIGENNAVLSVESNIPVFENNDQSNGNERITISGLTVRLDLSSSYAYDALCMVKVKYCTFENLRFFNNAAGTPDSGKSAILLDGAIENDGEEASICYGNTISHCDIAHFGYGIKMMRYAKENMLFNNSIHDCRTDGVRLDKSPKNIISLNNIRNNSQNGLSVYQSHYNVIQENQFLNNLHCGIDVYKSCKGTIQSNVCNNNVREGILLSGSLSEHCCYNVISGNICNGNGNDQITHFYRSGICLSSWVMYTNVTNNNCFANFNYGIEEKNDASVSNNNIAGNTCLENVVDNIRTSGKSQVTSNKTS